MPEMPEVATVVNLLRPKIVGQNIENVDVYNTKLIKNIDANSFINSIVGSKIENIFNVGKYIVINLNNEMSIINHLRMTGKYSFYTKYHEPIIHDHVVFKLSEGVLYFNDARAFATFELRKNVDLYSTPPLNKLGNTPLNTDIDWLFDKIKRKASPIKNVLLDQSLVLGIGNIYANEALFNTGIHPSTPANKLSKNELKDLILAAGNIMQTATQMGGSSIQSYTSLNGQKGEFQNYLQVHNRNGLACNKCGSTIQKYWVGGRGTHFCPRCQKEK
ncbi:bifunctional DNA-formamidopyrimidine glycosylase/DNA-(apurinic or apyrimidinic site) lyase [Mycoplasma simbae]|uniref:bifunctional DNA-formamidopyrimidine glycosylase/DNA-(apurinic or apyrimidinic site) lyase n=1 Tax=Mycoplasma simbae TaxID=36744 RepID=UPI000494FFDD|nr:bifunctional DNA-formamidopyrimidine glycosylase/DNA-(apurinic or apyrimidinic site) lyase [Mycoplasma simbae]